MLRHDRTRLTYTLVCMGFGETSLACVLFGHKFCFHAWFPPLAFLNYLSSRVRLGSIIEEQMREWVEYPSIILSVSFLLSVSVSLCLFLSLSCCRISLSLSLCLCHLSVIPFPLCLISLSLAMALVCHTTPSFSSLAVYIATPILRHWIIVREFRTSSPPHFNHWSYEIAHSWLLQVWPCKTVSQSCDLFYSVVGTGLNISWISEIW
jgi:hypothetical protein